MKMEKDFVAVKPEPTPAGLSHLLRHKELWPEGFKWDFRLSTSCALGLYMKTFNAPGATVRTTALDKFDPAVRGSLFGLSSYPVEDRDVTPEMVADKIDKVIANAV